MSAHISGVTDEVRFSSMKSRASDRISNLFIRSPENLVTLLYFYYTTPEKFFLMIWGNVGVYGFGKILRRTSFAWLVAVCNKVVSVADIFPFIFFTHPVNTRTVGTVKFSCVYVYNVNGFGFRRSCFRR